MEKLEEALKEALSRNADETVRWTKYKEEHEAAIDNLKRFSEKIALDVMVPIGSKAFMPGQLYHTNEILVSHYQGIFSKCSSHQAQKLAGRRINTAIERLQSLETEREMYQNKLDMPYSEGVLPNSGEREIIEEYNEEEEELWRIQHRQRVREAKLQESEETTNAGEEKSHEEIMKALEDLEMMEELEEELKDLHVEDDETLQKLMSGEIQLAQEKRRISHTNNQTDIVVGNATESETERKTTKEASDNSKTFKTNGSNQEIDFTNNNSVPNTADYDSDASDSLSDNEIPQRVLDVEAEAKNLPTTKKIKLFKSKLREVEKELQEMPLKSMDDVNEKMNRLEVREYLSDYIDLLHDELAVEAEEKLTEKADERATGKEIPAKKKKKRITFASKDEIQLIDKNQAANAVMRSRIELTEDSYEALKLPPPSPKPVVLKSPSQHAVVDKKKEIEEKVLKSIQFVNENQSQHDFNLVDRIIESKSRALHLEVKHSNSVYVNRSNDITPDGKYTIGSPADIYDVFRDYFPSDQERNLKTLTVTTLSSTLDVEENKKEVATTEAIQPQQKEIEFINKEAPNEEVLKESNRDKPAKATEPKKSILRNKEKVQLENRNNGEITKQRSTKTKSPKDSVPFSGFDLVMGDVIEKPFENVENKSEPDPLPDEKFVDAYAPKKRISRFKQMRTNS